MLDFDWGGQASYEEKENKVQGTRHKAQGTRHKAQGTRYKVQGTRHKVQGTRKVKGARDKEGSEGLRMEDSRQFAIINEKSNVGAIQERF
jgi:hypothetical protein